MENRFTLGYGWEQILEDNKNETELYEISKIADTFKELGATVDEELINWIKEADTNEICDKLNELNNKQ